MLLVLDSTEPLPLVCWLVVVPTGDGSRRWKKPCFLAGSGSGAYTGSGVGSRRENKGIVGIGSEVRIK